MGGTRRDGEFDDAVGPQPTVSLQVRSTGCGMRAANAAGLANIAYADISISESTFAPYRRSLSERAYCRRDRWTLQLFSVTTMDPEKRAATWPGSCATPVAVGSAFTYNPSAANVGPAVLDAVATDTNPEADRSVSAGSSSR